MKAIKAGGIVESGPRIACILSLALGSMMLGTPPALAAADAGHASAPPAKTAHAEKKLGAYLGAADAHYPSWFKESFLEFSDDIADAADQGKRVVLLFTQDGCPYCNALVEQNLSQKHIEEKMREHFDVLAVNMWGDREVTTVQGVAYNEKSFAAALKVQFTPTLLFLNEQGQTILRLNGYLPPARFEAALDYIAGKKEAELSFRDYFQQVQAQRPAAGKGANALISAPFFSTEKLDLSKPRGKPYALFFEQKDCPNCETLHNGPLADPQTREILARFDNYQLDMWSDAELIGKDGQPSSARALAHELNVKYAPSLILFNAQGEEIIRSEAFFKVFHTQSIFDYVLSEGYKTEPSFQRYISARAEHIREQGIDVDIWR